MKIEVSRYVKMSGYVKEYIHDNNFYLKSIFNAIIVQLL